MGSWSRRPLPTASPPTDWGQLGEPQECQRAWAQGLLPEQPSFLPSPPGVLVNVQPSHRAWCQPGLPQASSQQEVPTAGLCRGSGTLLECHSEYRPVRGGGGLVFPELEGGFQWGWRRGRASAAPPGHLALWVPLKPPRWDHKPGWRQAQSLWPAHKQAKIQTWVGSFPR